MGDYNVIAQKLKKEFPSLADTPIKRLYDRARHHCRQVKRGTGILSQEIDQPHISKTTVLTVSKKYLLSKNLWQNSICLSGLRRVDDVLEYVGEVQMGGNIPFRQCIDISSVGCLLIIVDVKDWLEGDSFPNDIIHTSLSVGHGPDEFILVMMAGSSTIRADKGQKYWDNEFVQDIMTNMNLTVKGDGTLHHHTTGKFYGFGWIAKYNSLVGGICSYGKVALKKGKTEKDVKNLYDQFTVDINCMTNTLNDIIPGVVEKGQCIAHELVKMSNSIGTHPYEKIKYFSEGMILGMVCNDAQTREVHFEKDCSYTLVGIPFAADDINTNGMFVFELIWGEGKCITIQLNPGTVLYYNAYGIMHHQWSLINQAQSSQEFDFWNIATYTNQEFYQKVMRSLSRSQHNNI